MDEVLQIAYPGMEQPVFPAQELAEEPAAVLKQ